MTAILPASAKRTNKGRFCRAQVFIRNNNAEDRLTASWFDIEKQEKGKKKHVRDPEVCSGFSLRGRQLVELIVLAEACCEACGTVLRLSNSINKKVSGLESPLYMLLNCGCGETNIC